MNLETLTPIQVRAELMRRSFEAFTTWAWPLIQDGRPYVPNAIADRIIATLQAAADGVLTKVLVACPPGVGKTTILACYAGWRRARDPGWRSIHAGHAFELAATESRRVRRLVTTDEFKSLFPAVVIRDDENTAGLWATTRNGVYTAVGVEGAVTGRRANEVCADDPLNAASRSSKAARDALWAWFTESLSTRVDGNGPTLIIQQRLDRDDLIGRLIEAGGWHLVELPAEDEHGEPLAPNVLPREKLAALKATIGAATYACQYLQRPSDDSNAAIKRTWWRFHRPAHVAENAPRPSGCDTDVPAVSTPTSFDKIVIACDLTFGGVKSSNDLACCQVWGLSQGARYLLAVWWRKATQLTQRDAIKELKRAYPRARVVIEKAAGGAGILEQLAADGIAAIGVPPLGSKAQRLDLVSPAIEAGLCYLPLGAAWLGDFVEELAGASKHDDAQDAAALALTELSTNTNDVERARKLLGMGAMLMEMANPWAIGPKIRPEATLEEQIQDAKAFEFWEAMRRR